jgi:BMFP domain-containing protein YqiC
MLYEEIWNAISDLVDFTKEDRENIEALEERVAALELKINGVRDHHLLWNTQLAKRIEKLEAFKDWYIETDLRERDNDAMAPGDFP